MHRPVAAAFGRATDWLTQAPRRGRQLAVVRMGIAGTWLLSLLSEWPNRQSTYGLQGPWTWDMAHEATQGSRLLSLLTLTPAPGWSLCVYLLSMAASVQLLLGWHTRLACVFFLLGVLSLQNYAYPLDYSGDILIRLTALYLMATRCGRVWSLDARQTRKAHRGAGAAGVAVWALLGALLAVCTLGPSPGRPWQLGTLWLVWAAQGWSWRACRVPGSVQARWLEAAGNAVHNAAVTVMMGQIVLVYFMSGTAKLGGATWRDGTAVYYALHELGMPFPALTEMICSSQALVALATWGTLILQIGFPLALLYSRTKNWALAATFCEHLGIAALMGLPYFSLAVLSADAIWLPAAWSRRSPPPSTKDNGHHLPHAYTRPPHDETPHVHGLLVTPRSPTPHSSAKPHEDHTVSRQTSPP